MSPSQTQHLRDTLLRTAREYPRGLSIETLRVCLQAAGFTAAQVQQLDTHLLYLSDKGLIRRVDKTHTPELEVWRITSQGIDDLARRGL